MNARRPQLSLNLSHENNNFTSSPLASPMIVLKSPPTPPLLPDSSSCDSISSCASSSSAQSEDSAQRTTAADSQSWKQRGHSLVLNSSWSAKKENAEDTFETPPHTPNCNPESGFFNFGPHTAAGGGGGSLHPQSLLGAGGGAMRRQVLTRQSSISSATSSVDDEENDQNEWTEEEKQVLQQTFDSYVESAATTEAPISKVGPPPPNLTQIVAKAVVRQPAPKVRPSRSASTDDNNKMDTDNTASSSSSGSTLGPESAEIQKWRHGLKSTRNQILSLVKERQHSAVDATPRPGLDATPRGGPSAAPLARANSMDFLPVSLPGPRVATAAKLSAKLQQGTGAQDGYVGPPIAGAHMRRPLFATMQRTNSLTSVQGSPSQPARPSASVTPQASTYKRKPSSAAAAAFSAFHLAPNPTSAAMARGGSDCGPSVDPLDHLPKPIGSYSSPDVPRLSTTSAESSSAGLVMVNPATQLRRSSVFDAPAKKPSGAGLGLEAAFEAGSARKRFASGSTAPVAVKNSGRRSTSPESKAAATVKRTLFPAFVVTEHEEEDELAPPTRSMKSLSLHPTVAVERPGRDASPDKDDAVKRNSLSDSPIFGQWAGFGSSQ